MDEIRDIIDKVVRGCAKCGIQVDDVLAAFVARTIVENDETTFALDKKMNAVNKEEIILQSIERLIERDNPALECQKMQVDYDSSFLKHDGEAQKTLRARNKMIQSHKIGIMDVMMEDANDFEALTVLYRKIFRFLLDFAPNSKGHDRSVEREVAAALESVFPRVGLKTFIQLSYDEKSAQLAELARIVLGIRLFNRDQGRGGAGIGNLDKEGQQLANTMVEDVESEVEFFTDACNKYQQAIQRAQLLRRRVAREEQQRAEAKTDDPGAAVVRAAEPPAGDGLLVPSEKLVDRWLKELSNRRQYLGFLRTLQDEMKSLYEKVTQIVDSIKDELVGVTHMVSNRASVSKELVYPRFDSLGALWVSLYEEMNVLVARSNTFGVLCRYRLSFTPTLDEKYFVALLAQDTTLETAVESSVELSKGGSMASAEAKGSVAAAQAKDASSVAKDDKMGATSSIITDTTADAKGGPPAVADEKGAKHADVASTSGAAAPAGAVQFVVTVEGVTIPESTAAGATLLSVHNTPDFLMLPLELQGYCPWSMVHSQGLLVPGKPALGVVRYDNLYYVCEHVRGLKEFMENPDLYLKAVRVKAIENPEYIHLLRLQRWFPSASIARLLEQDDFDATAAFGKPATKEASTSTPTHFIESYIDINYHWNEWELRRRALRIANLTKCVTTAQQTDQSHYRRDNDAQVYELRDKGTTTKKDAGTNPPIVTTYVAGLRGQPDRTSAAVSKFVSRGIRAAAGGGVSDAKEDAADDAPPEQQRARIVTLKLDL
jgi:hypothetical protein